MTRGMRAYSEVAGERHELKLGDPSYPSCVAELKGAPGTLYVVGDPTALSTPSLSIVGARRATPYGISCAQMAATCAAASGVCVVSGGAIGCDQAAGRAALEAGGVHVAVLGTGADVCYPASAAGMLERAVGSGGAVVSLERWGTQPKPWAFPKRNRVIAALSEALLVTEATVPSGTFSTAEAACELDREVLAVPGSIYSPESKGPNWLISCGASPIVDEESLEVAISRIYRTLRLKHPPAEGLPSVSELADRAMRMIVSDPMRPEAIAAALSLTPEECLMLLSELELTGAATRLKDGRLAPSGSSLHALSGLGNNRGRDA